MSKYSELAAKLDEHADRAATTWADAELTLAAAAMRELEAERDRLRDALQLALGPVLLGALDRDQIIADYGMLGWENYSRARAALEEKP